MNVYKINCNKEVFFLWVIWKFEKYVKYLFNFNNWKLILEKSDLEVDIILDIMIFGCYGKKNEKYCFNFKIIVFIIFIMYRDIW